MGLSPLMMITVVVIGVFIVIKILKIPIKFIFKLLINTAIGFILLTAFNFFGAIIGFTLTINAVNIILVGILGIPGVILLIIFSFI